MTISLYTLMEITLKPTLTALTTLTTLDPYAHSNRFSSTPTSTLFRLKLLCQKSPILVDRLGYSSWWIGAPDRQCHVGS